MTKVKFFSWTTCLMLILSTAILTFAQKNGKWGVLKDIAEVLGKIETERAKNVKSGYFKNHTLFGSFTETSSTVYNGHNATFKRTEFDILWIPVYSFNMEISYMYFDNTLPVSLLPTSPFLSSLKFRTIDLKGEWSDMGSEIQLDFFTRWGGKILVLFIGFIAFLYFKNE
jgi:hypothetical protein